MAILTIVGRAGEDDPYFIILNLIPMAPFLELVWSLEIKFRRVKDPAPSYKETYFNFGFYPFHPELLNLSRSETSIICSFVKYFWSLPCFLSTTLNRHHFANRLS